MPLLFRYVEARVNRSYRFVDTMFLLIMRPGRIKVKHHEYALDAPQNLRRNISFPVSTALEKVGIHRNWDIGPLWTMSGRQSI